MVPDDLMQDALTKMLTAYGEVGLRERSHDQLMSLGWRTMKNLLIDRTRKKTEQLKDPHGDDDNRPLDLADHRPDAELDLSTRRRAAVVQQYMATLSSEERCFLSHVIETDSVPQAKEHCGWPPKSPYYVLRRLFSDMRDALKGRV